MLQFRKELKSLWEGAHTSNERLLADFREWCTRAEQSGIQGLEEFVAYLQVVSSDARACVGLSGRRGAEKARNPPLRRVFFSASGVRRDYLIFVSL